MALQTLLIVADPPDHRQVDQSLHECLLVPIGSEAALVHYVRLIALQGAKTALVVPAPLADRMDGLAHLDGVEVRVCGNGALDLRGAHRRRAITETLLINAAHLPTVDVRAAWRRHCSSGADVSVFQAGEGSDYCCEQVHLDASGTVQGTFRAYEDSFRNQRWERVPLALAVSPAASRILASCPFATFEELVERTVAAVELRGGLVERTSIPAVTAHANPLDRFLALIRRTGTCPDANRGPAFSGADIGPGVRLTGPLQLGRDVRIEPGAMVVGPTSMGDRVTIRKGAVVIHCVVLPGVTVTADRCHHRRILGLKDASPTFPPSVGEVRIWPRAGVYDPSSERRGGDLIKRGFDAIMASVGLLLFSPVFALTALVIKGASQGPVFYRQRRQSRGGMEFDCWKFRTMVDGADRRQGALRRRNMVDGPQFKIPNDPRVTAPGGFLRRSNIDELPQLVNVLLGQMSLVVPRPSPDEENQYCPAWRKARLSVRPGITGLWQVTRSSDRSRSDFQEWIYYDLQYLENRSFWLDLQILWQTLRVLLRVGPSERWRRRWTPATTGRVSCLNQGRPRNIRDLHNSSSH